jgi:hypothetical protein
MKEGITMAKYQIQGYFSTKDCQRIKEKLQGKTYMNFNIQYGGIAGNNEIIVTSNNENYNDSELKEMFIHCALTSL